MKKIVTYNRKTSKMQINKVKQPGQSEMDPMQMIFSPPLPLLLCGFPIDFFFIYVWAPIWLHLAVD